MTVKVRIGTKLSIIAGLAVVLVAGMVVNEQLSNGTLLDSKLAADREQALIRDIAGAEASLGRMQLAVREMRYAVTPQALDNASAAVTAQANGGRQSLERAIDRVTRADDKARLARVKDLVEAYRGVANELGNAALSAPESPRNGSASSRISGSRSRFPTSPSGRTSRPRCMRRTISF